MATIESPVADFTGVVIGVHFKDGAAESEHEGALNYFRRHGYTVTEPEPKEPEAPKAPADPEDPKVPADPEGTPEAPAGNGSTDDWRAYAVARGIAPEAAAELSRDELKAAVANIDAE
ncbi:hypothetical protein GCM10023081_46810 [Arthrobacter ginkgonis]|uniref:Uncharacterized protein n=1 Tax=Arthrobacter ginkgonis TaxID=1630594 RepID=A0ABP7DJ66_9MICC